MTGRPLKALDFRLMATKPLIRGFLIFCTGWSVAFAAGTAGKVDPSFNVALDGYVFVVILQPDDKIVIGGAFTTVNGIPSRGIVRLSRHGSIDMSFRPTLDGNVSGLVLQTNGQLVIGGGFTQVNGIARDGMARLNSDGSLDLTYMPGFYLPFSPFAIQSDGKLVFGVFKGVQRLNQDGSRDTNFVVTSSYFNAYVAAVTIQNDGKILIGGRFDEINGVPRWTVARLYPNGSVDPLFDTSRQDMGYDNRELIPQEDGSVLIGGDVVAKLTPQGRLSPDFTPAYFEPGSGVFAMSLDGTNMIVGGEFNSFDVARTNLARLMPNGIVDPDYDPGSAADDKIYATCLQPDGRLIVGGRFTVFAGEPRSYLVRLFGDQPTLDDLLPLNWSACYESCRAAEPPGRLT